MKKGPETGVEVLIQHNRDPSLPAQGTAAATKEVGIQLYQDYYSKLAT